MQLSSSAFVDRMLIPRQFTCDGDDLSPPLGWSAAPAATRSFALLFDDPDAPGGTWHHWAAYDMPPSLTALSAGASKKAGLLGFKEGINDFGRVGYGGPCPPRRHGPHHYRFQLLALSIAVLPVLPGQSCQEVEREARKHAMAEATLTGMYQR